MAGARLRHAPFYRLSRDPRLATLHQIHSDICLPARGRTGMLGDGDALFENTARTSDSRQDRGLPPHPAGGRRTSAVAAVHAGWRGTVAHIAQSAVRAMWQEFGTEARRLHAAIGPGIGKCCYEVGAEVAAQFGETGPGHIDLAEANRRQLADAGVPEAQIHVAALCTRCGGDFHSYRRDKEKAGRMLSFVGVK